MTEPPAQRTYFSERHGRGPRARPLKLEEIKRLVASIWTALDHDCHMQEALGYYCVDGSEDGYLSPDPGAHFLRVLHRDSVWPWDEHINSWDEDTLFDMVEAMHDLVAKPLEGNYHSFSNCGWHYSTFDRLSGRARYRQEMNDLPASADPESVTQKVQSAVQRFRARGSSMEERRVAVRDLADVLEALRSEAKKHMTKKDEGALFDIANNFHIRHNDEAQLRDYDVIWLAWIFYFYLATIQALLHTIERSNVMPLA